MSLREFYEWQLMFGDIWPAEEAAAEQQARARAQNRLQQPPLR